MVYYDTGLFMMAMGQSGDRGMVVTRSVCIDGLTTCLSDARLLELNATIVDRRGRAMFIRACCDVNG